LPAVQSASTSQPPDGSHFKLVLQAPDRHTVAALPVVQGPSPLAKPQSPSGSHTADRQTVPPLTAVQGPSPLEKPHSLSFVSQTLLAQTRRLAAGVQRASSVGDTCGGSLGMGAPLLSWGVHV
jgi:hypothetical protein